MEKVETFSMSFAYVTYAFNRYLQLCWRFQIHEIDTDL